MFRAPSSQNEVSSAPATGTPHDRKTWGSILNIDRGVEIEREPDAEQPTVAERDEKPFQRLHSRTLQALQSPGRRLSRAAPPPPSVSAIALDDSDAGAASHSAHNTPGANNGHCAGQASSSESDADENENYSQARIPSPARKRRRRRIPRVASSLSLDSCDSEEENLVAAAVGAAAQPLADRSNDAMGATTRLALRTRKKGPALPASLKKPRTVKPAISKRVNHKDVPSRAKDLLLQQQQADLFLKAKKAASKTSASKSFKSSIDTCVRCGRVGVALSEGKLCLGKCYATPPLSDFGAPSATPNSSGAVSLLGKRDTNGVSKAVKHVSKRIPLINLTELPRGNAATDDRMLFFSFVPKRHSFPDDAPVSKYSPFASAADAMIGVNSNEVCAVCGSSMGLVNCRSCPLAFHAHCHNPPLQQIAGSFQCKACCNGKKGNAPVKKPTSITGAFDRITAEAGEGNPIDFVLHPSLHQSFIRRHKTDWLRCNRCRRMRAVFARSLSESVRIPFECSDAFWLPASQRSCNGEVSPEEALLLSVATEKVRNRSKARVRLFYHHFGEKNRADYGFLEPDAVVCLDDSDEDIPPAAPAGTTPATPASNQPAKTSPVLQAPAPPNMPRSDTRETPAMSGNLGMPMPLPGGSPGTTAAASGARQMRASVRPGANRAASTANAPLIAQGNGLRPAGLGPAPGSTARIASSLPQASAAAPGNVHPAPNAAPVGGRNGSSTASQTALPLNGVRSMPPVLRTAGSRHLQAALSLPGPGTRVPQIRHPQAPMSVSTIPASGARANVVSSSNQLVTTGQGVPRTSGMEQLNQQQTTSRMGAHFRQAVTAGRSQALTVSRTPQQMAVVQNNVPARGSAPDTLIPANARPYVNGSAHPVPETQAQPDVSRTPVPTSTPAPAPVVSPGSTSAGASSVQDQLLIRVAALNEFGDVEDQLVDLVLAKNATLFQLFNAFGDSPDRFQRQAVRLARSHMGAAAAAAPSAPHVTPPAQVPQAVPAITAATEPSSAPAIAAASTPSSTPAITVANAPSAGSQANGLNARSVAQSSESIPEVVAGPSTPQPQAGPPLRVLSDAEKHRFNEEFRQVRIQQLAQSIQLDSVMLREMRAAPTLNISRLHANHNQSKKRMENSHDTQLRNVVQRILQARSQPQ